MRPRLQRFPPRYRPIARDPSVSRAGAGPLADCGEGTRQPRLWYTPPRYRPLPDPAANRIGRVWFQGRDSNPNYESQNLASYH